MSRSEIHLSAYNPALVVISGFHILFHAYETLLTEVQIL